MSKAWLLAAFMAAGAWAGTAAADCACQQYPGAAGPVTATGYEAVTEVGGPGDSACADCDDSGSRCGRRNGCGCPLCAIETLCRRCGAKKAAIGAFNCQCRGSYKFPVPPQYTYHWPGMYSQQTMTEYSSPYRFPPLKLPNEVFGGGNSKGGTTDLDDEPRQSAAPVAPSPQGAWKPVSRMGSAEPGRLPSTDGAQGTATTESPAQSQKMKARLGIR